MFSAPRPATPSHPERFLARKVKTTIEITDKKGSKEIGKRRKIKSKSLSDTCTVLLNVWRAKGGGAAICQDYATKLVPKRDLCYCE